MKWAQRNLWWRRSCGPVVIGEHERSTVTGPMRKVVADVTHAELTGDAKLGNTHAIPLVCNLASWTTRIVWWL